MSKPFDATLNALIDAHVADWANFLAARAGVPPGPAAVLDTDLSSTLQADRLFRIGGAVPYALHLELESTSRLGIPEELLRYNIAARKSAALPVNSVIVLLRPKAAASDLTGLLKLPDANGVTYLTFRYTVVRLWEESFDAILNAGVGLAPLALLTNEASGDLPTAVTQFHDRLQRESIPGNVTKELLGFTSVLGGLRYDVEPFRRLIMQGRNILEDSSTYKWIMQQGHEKGMAQGVAQGVIEGSLQEARRMLLIQGRKRFGKAPAAVETQFQTIADTARLERMAERILDAAGWDDLLATQ